MSERLTDEQLSEIVDAAYNELFRLCRPDERWRMSIPANPLRDSDLIIVDCLNALKDRADQLKAQNDAARAALVDPEVGA